jgi:hypothetical protein
MRAITRGNLFSDERSSRDFGGKYRIANESQGGELMPIAKEPKPMPSSLDYVPENSVPYTVSSRDSWEKLAQRSDVQNAGMSAIDLCYFNFKTRNFAEINWYLNRKIGCRHATRDGSNYLFSDSDKYTQNCPSPGVVYLPKHGSIAPVHETTEEPKLNAWLGVVGKVGTMFLVVGIETITGAVVSLDDPTKWMAIGASVNRAGLGWGASGGAAFVFITGVSNPQQLNGWQQADGDFNLALGENWGKMAKSASKVKKIKPVMDAMLKIGAKTPGTLKKLLKTEPNKYIDLVKAVKSVRDYKNLKAGEEPEVFMWDIPWGSGGVEVSLFYGLQNFNALWDGTE